MPALTKWWEQPSCSVPHTDRSHTVNIQITHIQCPFFLQVREGAIVCVFFFFPFHYVEIRPGLVLGRWRISLTEWSKNNQFQMLLVSVVMASLTILISQAQWNFSFK